MESLESNGVERVFLRLLNCDTDHGLEELLKKFLIPVLLSLQSDKALFPKLNELLGHVNKRLQHRTEVKLPFYALIELIKRTDLTPFTMNMGVLYVKKSYERLSLEERLANVDLMFGCLGSLSEFQGDVIMSVMLPTLKSLRIPNYKEKQEKLVPSVQREEIAKKIFEFSLKVLLMPYIVLTDKESWKNQPSLSPDKISGILKHVPSLTPEELEGAKETLVNLASCEIFNFHPPLIGGLMVVAGADTRCSVSDAAESRLKKLRTTVDWEDEKVVVLLYSLFLGHDKLPAGLKSRSYGVKAGSLRLRMKLLPVLTLSEYAANLFPLNIQMPKFPRSCQISSQKSAGSAKFVDMGTLVETSTKVVFGGLFGTDVNRQLNLSSVQFVHKICDDASFTVVKTIGPMLKQGLLKSVQSAANADLKLSGRVYLGLGKLSTRCPDLFSSDVYLLSLLLSMLEQEDRELIADLKEGLFLMTEAYKAVLGTEEEAMLEELLLKYINKSDSTACCVALRFSNILHPTSHLPSRYLCLLALGSSSQEVVDEARAGLRGSDNDKLPEFEETVRYISNSTRERLNTPSLCYTVGTHRLPYVPVVFEEVLKFVRQCLEVGVPDHVVTESEKLRKLREILSSLPEEVVSQYRELLMSALVPAAPGNLHLHAMEHLAQLSGALPETLSLSLPWSEVFLTSSLPSLRYHTATLLGIAARSSSDISLVDSWAERILSLLNDKNGTFEKHDGSILAAGFLAPCTSQYLTSKLLSKVISFFNSDHLSGVCTAVSQSATSLDLGTFIGNESLEKLHQHFITGISQTKEQKTLISLTTGIGSLHVHCKTLRLDQTLNTLFNTSKHNLMELNFSTGKTLSVMASGAGSSPSILDVFVNVVEPGVARETQITKDILHKIIREYVLGDVREIQLQAAAIWILSLLKYCTDSISIKSYRSDIQHALSVLLSNKDTVTQEIASEALSLLYTTADDGTKSHLIDMLKFTLLNETVPHKHVDMDTKIFSTEDIGKLPSSLGGGNLTTYKELCSLASDMGQPEMIYQFMHLSNHSAIWSDRIGAAFGVGNLVKCAGEELQPYLASIIPRIYRYQYDPNLKVQQSMSNIWSVMVAKPKETVDKYLKEIIADLKSNIHSRMWRTRESCSNALGDLVRTRTHDDVILAEMPEFWELVLKIMDDIKESVRKSASKTSEVLSKASISACNIDHGARGARAISTILPVLLDKGITSSLVEVQTVSIVTVMKISENAGKLIAPHVHVIIPAFIAASANIEPKAFGQVTTMVSGNTEDKDKMEAARAALALTSPLISVIEKCVRCVDDTQLETLVVKLSSLAKSSVGLTPRVTLLHTVSLLAVYQQQDLTKWVGKLMGAMFVVLSDRSPAVKDKCAATVAVLFRYAKPSTVDNVLDKLRSWYLEKDDSIKHLVAMVMSKITNSAPDVLRTVHGAVIPLSLFGKHSKEEKEKELWEMVWLELGVSDQSVVLLHLSEISSLCALSLSSTSWTNRIQSADTLATVATVLSSSYPPPQLSANVELLLNATTGRTFPGKSAILAALAKSLTAPKRSNLSDLGVEEERVMSVFLREVRKKDADYVSHVMRSLGDVLLGVEVSDCWEDVWGICCTHLVPPEDEEEEGEESKEKRKKTETFTIQTVTQESAVLLLGVGWRVCKNKPEKIVQLSEFLAGNMRICTWKIQLSVLCSIQHVLNSIGTSQKSSTVQFTEELKMSVYQAVIPGVLRCVDDTKHTTVRALALKLIAQIFDSCLSANIRLKTDIIKEVLLHLRDQVSVESNQNLKSQGIEIVSNLEKNFLTS